MHRHLTATEAFGSFCGVFQPYMMCQQQFSQFFYKNKPYLFIQIDRVHRYNKNSRSLKTKRTNLQSTHNIHVNSIKYQSIYANKYDYIQVSRIFMSQDLQR